jgi:HAD superfamily hydrolase (TIGR01509 family)
VAQFGSAFAWGAKGRTFESCRSDHFFSMKAVFDVGKVLGNAQFAWKDILRTSSQSFSPSKYLDLTIADMPEYLAMETGHLSISDYLEFIQTEFGLASRDAATRVHESILLEEFPGVREVIEQLHSLGFETATLSNNNPIHWKLFTASGRYPSVELIQHKIASFELGYMKPDPKIFQVFCTKTGWDPGEITFVDDSQANVDAAIRCGWNAFRVDPALPMAPQLRYGFGLTEPCS